jgi:uncharacterized oxidoreductase
MTSALIAHLEAKDNAVIVYTNSALSFVPMSYSATKAAIHSYALSQRFLLKDSKVRVLEIAPPWVASKGQKRSATMPQTNIPSSTLSTPRP